MGYYYKRLKDLREDNDYKQKDIAEYLNIRQEYYSKYELGKIEIPAHKIIKLAKLYKVSTDYILGLTKDPTPHWSAQSSKINKVDMQHSNINNSNINIKQG